MPPSDRRPRPGRTPVAPRSCRGELSRQPAAAAPDRRVPRARAPGVLRALASLDQPRGLLGQTDALLLGRGRQEPEERSEEHTSELQSQSNLVCRLLLEKKK